MSGYLPSKMPRAYSLPVSTGTGGGSGFVPSKQPFFSCNPAPTLIKRGRPCSVEPSQGALYKRQQRAVATRVFVDMAGPHRFLPHSTKTGLRIEVDTVLEQFQTSPVPTMSRPLRPCAFKNECVFSTPGLGSTIYKVGVAIQLPDNSAFNTGAGLDVMACLVDKYHS
jgi:hypothetical protein